MAVRDMDIAAELIGIRLYRTKLLAFAVSSFYAGVAGAMLVFLLIVEPNGLARLWQIGKQKLRVWPFPY